MGGWLGGWLEKTGERACLVGFGRLFQTRVSLRQLSPVSSVSGLSCSSLFILRRPKKKRRKKEGFLFDWDLIIHIHPVVNIFLAHSILLGMVSYCCPSSSYSSFR